MKLIHGIDEQRHDDRFRLFIWLLFAFTLALQTVCVWGFLLCLLEIGPRSLSAYIPLIGVLALVPLLLNLLWLLESYCLTAEGIMIRHAVFRELIPWEKCKEIGVFAVAMLRNESIYPYLLVFLSKRGIKDICEELVNLNVCFFFRSDVKCFRLTEQRMAEFQAYIPNIMRYDWNDLHARYEPAADSTDLSNPKSPWPGTQESERRRREKKLLKK